MFRSMLRIISLVLFTTTAIFSQTNVAIGKAATASSMEGDGMAADFAVDGDSTTRWGSDWINDVDPGVGWIAVDLGSTMTIGKIRILWENAAALEYDLQSSDDGAVWTTFLSVTDGVGPEDRVIELATPVTTKHVRIDCKSRTTGYGYSIYEWQLYTADSSPLNAMGLQKNQMQKSNLVFSSGLKLQNANLYTIQGQPINTSVKQQMVVTK